MSDSKNAMGKNLYVVGKYRAKKKKNVDVMPAVPVHNASGSTMNKSGVGGQSADGNNEDVRKENCNKAEYNQRTGSFQMFLFSSLQLNVQYY